MFEIPVLGVVFSLPSQTPLLVFLLLQPNIITRYNILHHGVILRTQYSYNCKKTPGFLPTFIYNTNPYVVNKRTT